MNRLGIGFFKLRLILMVAFSCFLWLDDARVTAMFAWYVWAQIEYLLHMLNLEDKHISEWEKKLKEMIKDEDAK